jgi:hypothetical protein
LDIPSPGVYAVQVNFAAGGSYLEFLWAGAEQGDDIQGVANGSSKAIGIPLASNGAFAVEIPRSERGNPGYDATAAQIAFAHELVRTTSVQDAMAKLNTAVTNNNNNPIIAVMVGHGNVSYINVGKAQNAPLDQNDGLFIKDNNQWVQNFCNGLNGQPGTGLNGKISSLFLLTCDVGQNYANNPNHLIKSLANGLHKVGGTSVTVKGYDNKVWAVLPGPRRPGNFLTVADANLITLTVG